VIISDAAIETAADYADRYISGRFQPDKSVDLLDTACARVKVALAARPGLLEDAEGELAGLERRIESLERDRDNLLEIDAERLAALREAVTAATTRRDELERRWKEEREATHAVLAAREALRAAREPAAEGAEAPDAEALKQSLVEASARLAALQSDGGLLFSEVGPEAIAKVVSDWTGIPLGRLAQDQAAMVGEMQSLLARRVHGQDYALSVMARSLQVAKAGLKDPDRPLGVFLLTGPSGTGKTETALALAELLFGSEKNMVMVNMGEFQEKHTVSRLIGSPPGYVGYGEGGMLTEAVRRQPYCVVLLDEVEKAHPDIMNLFYQVFDKGLLQDGEGKEVRFRNTVILLTSNLGSDTIEKLLREKREAREDESSMMSAALEAIRPRLNEHFKPALVGRMTLLPFATLSDAALKTIVTQKLRRIAAQLQANSKITLEWSAAVADNIAARCTEVETGARNIEYILNLHILPRLSKALLQGMGEARAREEQGLAPYRLARLDMDAAGQCDAVLAP
ncbi:MAG: AAA family ATPase, partial [Candidatus Accumulibacter sp.]|nr:AAA family ATPase [Accumulibacter sp.]